MHSRPDNVRHHFAMGPALLALCLAAGGCAGEHRLREHDRKLEDLRLEIARHEEAIGRARDTVDELRNSWASLLARESLASKETASLPAALRRLALRMDDADGKRTKLEERLSSAERRAAELLQSFTLLSSSLNAAEGDLAALRPIRGVAPFGADKAVAATGGPEREPADRAALGAQVPAGAPGGGDGWSGNVAGSSGGALVGALVFALGMAVALGCVYLGSRLRAAPAVATAAAASVREPPAAPAHASAPVAAARAAPPAVAPQEPSAIAELQPEPETEPDAAQETEGGDDFSTQAVDDFFDEAEKASVRFAGSASRDWQANQPAADSDPPTEAIDDPADTVVVTVPQPMEPEVSVRASPALTEPIADMPGRTQVIGDQDDSMESAMSPPPAAPAALESTRPRARPAVLKRPSASSDEKNLLDELENLLGKKIGDGRA